MQLQDLCAEVVLTGKLVFTLSHFPTLLAHAAQRAADRTAAPWRLAGGCSRR